MVCLVYDAHHRLLRVGPVVENETHSTVNVHHRLLSLLPVDGYLSCFQTWEFLLFGSALEITRSLLHARLAISYWAHCFCVFSAVNNGPVQLEFRYLFKVAPWRSLGLFPGFLRNVVVLVLMCFKNPYRFDCCYTGLHSHRMFKSSSVQSVQSSPFSSLISTYLFAILKIVIL